MQRFSFPIQALPLAMILGGLAIPPPESAGETRRSSATQSVRQSPVAYGDSGRIGAGVRFVSFTAPEHDIRLPIALVPARGRAWEGTGQGSERAAPALALPARKATDAAGRNGAVTPERALVTTAASLAVVVGMFLLLVWFQRRASGHGRSVLPGAVVQTLGRVPLNGRQEMQLVRVGNKLLLLAVTATSAETLTEITDPEEIDRLSGICRHEQPGSISASFREILNQLQQPSSAARLR